MQTTNYKLQQTTGSGLASYPKRQTTVFREVLFRYLEKPWFVPRFVRALRDKAAKRQPP